MDIVPSKTLQTIDNISGCWWVLVASSGILEILDLEGSWPRQEDNSINRVSYQIMILTSPSKDTAPP